MLTYLTLDLIVLATIILVIVRSPIKGLSLKRVLYLAALLIVLTAVFDNVIIHAQIVAYDNVKVLGAYLGKAPVEDFAYAIAAAVFVPYMWLRSKRDDA